MNNTNPLDYQSSIRKKLLDLLMFSLYGDARTIYREYVQNSLDSINQAVNQGILSKSKDGVVNIDIDVKSKRIKIRDNGTGIPFAEAVQRLLDISGSKKDGVTAAGQFGIGRLAGGGYCHELIFKTSAVGEDKATIVSFDVDQISKMVKDDEEDYLATYVVDKCTTKQVVDEAVDDHYFEVVLNGVRTEMAPVLLHEEDVIEYLNAVAPVGYKSEFVNGLIYASTEANPEFKDLHENLEKVQVFVGRHKIEKQYGLSIVGTKDPIDRLEYFKIQNDTYGLLAWGWFALTKYTIQIPKEDKLSCIRLRKHNIQIGDSNLLSGKPLWKEDRSNSYFYGELFVTHDNIVPNGARDGLAPTPEKEALFEELSNYFKLLSVVYTKANAAKKAIDKIIEGTSIIDATHKVSDRRATDLIDNMGVGAFLKLENNAEFIPQKHMLELYRPDFDEAKRKAEEARALVLLQNQQSPTKTPASVDIPQSAKTPHADKEDAISYQETPTISTIEPVLNEPEEYDSCALHEVETQTVVRNTPSSGKNLAKNFLSELELHVSQDELWTIRRVFRVIDTYCPDNEHDQHLIETLKREVVQEFKNERI